jgi:hypothetical protein
MKNVHKIVNLTAGKPCNTDTCVFLNSIVTALAAFEILHVPEEGW